MPDCEKCMNEQRILDLEEDKKRNSEQHKEFYDNFKALAVSDGRKEERENARDRSIESISKMISELKADIKSLKDQPVKRVDTIVDKIIDKLITAGFIAIGGYIVFVLK